MRFPCLALWLALTALPAVATTPVQSVETLGTETFDTWQVPGDGFKLFCRQPCEADPAGIREYYQGFRALLPELIGFHGVDVVQELKPVELHLNASRICPNFGAQVAGYARVGYHRGFDNAKGLTCLFEVERDRINANNGQPLRLQPGLAGRRDQHVLSLHEYAHVILFERHRWSYEYFTYWASWAIADPSSPLADPCNDWYGQFADTAAVHRLCRDHGLTRDTVRQALIELDRRFRAGQGFSSMWSSFGTTTSLAQLRTVLDGLLRTDTAAAFRVGGWDALNIGAEFPVGPAASSHSGAGGLLALDVPAGAVPTARTLKLDWLNGTTGSVPFIVGSRMFALVEDGENDADWIPRTRFNAPLTLRITPEPTVQNPEPLEEYVVYRMDRDANGKSSWRSLPGSRFDVASGQLQAPIERTGHYAYGPRQRAPGGLFYDPAFDGHGFDIQASGDQVLVLVYTYDAGGQPLWLLGNAPLGNIIGESETAVRIPLLRFRWDAAQGVAIPTPAGELDLQFFASSQSERYDVGANARVRLPGTPAANGVDLRLQPIVFEGNALPQVQTTGIWFNPADPGWGLTIDRKGEAEAAVAYYYDADGNPRWALGFRPTSQASVALDTFRGYCLGCPVQALQPTPAGTLDVFFDDRGRSGQVRLDVGWPNASGPRWQRNGAMVAPLSDPPRYR